MKKTILADVVGKVDDPRSERNQKHSFETVIGTSFLAALSGLDTFSGFSEFTENYCDALKEYFDLKNGVPSHDTYRKVWNTINPTQFYEAFSLFVDTLKVVASKNISIDGKVIKNSGKGSPIKVVSAWCENNQLVLAQQKVDPTSNEITTIPKLLRLLDIVGCTITIDAAGAQRNICEHIVEQQGNYVIALKRNQVSLFDDVKLFFDDKDIQIKSSYHHSVNKAHGRLETRDCYATDDVDWLQKEHNWPFLRSIAMVHSTRAYKGRRTEETRFYISSLPADAENIAYIARSHWCIENKLHWRLDVVFNEDSACIRNENGAENIDILRKWCLNVLHRVKTKPEQSLKSVMRKNCMSFNHLTQSVIKIFHA